MILQNMKKQYRNLLRMPINRRNRRRLINHNPSLISNNCNGAVILHDLGLRFNMPTVNLYIDFPDYIKFCKDVKHYLSLPPDALRQGPTSLQGWPTGILEDIHLNFVHYASFTFAKEKWFERAKRVDMNNLFFMLTQRDGCTADDVRAFNDLPYKYKVAFTAKPMPDVACVFYDPRFVENGKVKVLSDYISKFSGRRIIDVFDYVDFLNQGQLRYR